MMWYDRLRIPSIVTPDGAKYFFEYEDLTTEAQNKTSVHQLADGSKPIGQNGGLGERSYPVVAIISGDDYDQVADALDTSLGLPGNSVIEHPLYGVRAVIVRGWKRTDAVVNAAFQATFELQLTEVFTEVEPEGSQWTASVVMAAMDEVAIVTGDIAAAGYNVKKPGLLARAIARIKAFVRKFRAAMGKVLDKASQYRALAEVAIATIEGGIDALMSLPATLFSMVHTLVRFPARVAARLGDKVKGYSDLLDDLVGSNILAVDADSRNQRIEMQAFSAACTAALAESYLYASQNSAAAAESTGAINEAVFDAIESGEGFVTREDATSAAEALLDGWTATQQALDDQEVASYSGTLETRFSVSDELGASMSDIVYRSAAVLLRLAFQLRQERRIVLMDEDTPLERCFRVYGTTRPRTYDFFIATNKLEGGEFFILPKGREIRYYV